jgi:5-formyltetrahydrofolate cyclo-ligase
MEKNDLRREMRARLKNLSDGLYLAVGIETALELIGKPPRTVFTYLAHGKEIDTTPLNAHYIAEGAVVSAPITRGQYMAFHRIARSSGPFAIGAYGIREPLPDAPQVFPPAIPSDDATSATNEKDASAILFPALILVPGLAFSIRGERLGRGAGYYDRFLADLLAFTGPRRREEITLAGVCHDFQIVDRIPTETHDIPVDCLLTGKNAILCR